jgi:type II secretory pathway component PulF
MPEFDLALLKAGEESGRLDSSLRLLARYYNERAALIRQMLGDLAYPLVLMHFAVFLLPFASFFISGDWVAYLRQTLGVLVPFYLLIAIFLFASQGRHGETWRSIWEKLLSGVPMLGTARRSLALARASAALEALLAAGVTIVEAWKLSAAASGSPTLNRVVARWQPALANGQTPAELVNESSFFPDIFKSQYASGEISGRLEENVGRLHEYFQEEGTRKLRHLAAWIPRLFYLCIVLVIAWKIVSFWQNYFNQIGQAAGW